VKNSTVVETTTTRKDPIRSESIEGEMHQKLFGGRTPPGHAGRWGSSKYLRAHRYIYGRAEQWRSDGGKDKGEMGGWGEDRRKERGKGMKERREGLCPTRN